MNNTSIPIGSGIICTPEEYKTSLSNPTGLIHCLTRADSIGLTLTAQAGLLSLITVLYVLSLIVRNAVHRFQHGASMRIWYIFQKPMDIPMLSLFIADLIQSVGAVMDLKWIGSGKVEAGEFCSAQGIIKQLGEVGVAISTLMIALYTFIGVWMGRPIQSNGITGAIIGVVWFFIALLTLLGNILNNGAEKAFERPAPYWCWIGRPYLMWILFGEYFWIWITILMSIITYIPLYFWLRGNVTFGDSSWWKLNIHRRVDSLEELKGIRRRSLIMLLYPAIYCCLTLPLSVVRWIEFVQEGDGHGIHVPPAATFAVITIFGLSGVCNAILLLRTRPESGLFGRLNRDDMSLAPSSRQLHVGEFLASGPGSNVGGEERDFGLLPSR